jgi:predicted Zn finger-like uncharacterized protein
METTTCPHCATRVSFSPEHVGMLVRCASCQQTFTLTRAAAAASNPLEFGADRAPSPPPARDDDWRPSRSRARDDDYDRNALYDPARKRRGPRPADGLDTAAMIVSIVGAAVFLFPLLSVIVCLVGTILSAVAISRGSNGQALTGLIVGLIGLLVFPLIFAFGFCLCIASHGGR